MTLLDYQTLTLSDLRNLDNLKNDEDPKDENNPRNDNDPQNGDTPQKEDNPKNKDNLKTVLKNEDDLKKYPQKDGLPLGAIYVVDIFRFAVFF